MLLLLLAVSVVTFLLVELSPIDAVSSYIGENGVSDEQREIITEYWGLNDPPTVRYVKWITNILHGDMGTSMVYRQPVIKVIGERFKLSLILMAVSWVVSGLFGLLLGIIAAVYKGRVVDKIIRVYCLLLESSPAFWIGIVLLLFFAVYLDILPMGLAAPIGMSIEEATLPQRIYHLVLPALALMLTGISKIALQTREKMIQVFESDFALFARTRGEGKWTFVRRHGLRNILLPFITLQFGSISELFGGSVLAESVFTYPGLGEATVQSGLRGDMPLFLGIALFSALFVFCGNLIANILYAVVDPRIREGGRFQ
ncbi:MAG: ABC transporter permease [Firmicutes bacterium]|nr:ABC transporter permease [Bacillota bacterium]